MRELKNDGCGFIILIAIAAFSVCAIGDCVGDHYRCTVCLGKNPAAECKEVCR